MSNNTVNRNGYTYELLFGEAKELRAAALGRCDGLLKEVAPFGYLKGLVVAKSDTEPDKKPLYMVRMETADGVRMYATNSDNVAKQIADIAGMMNDGEVALIRTTMGTSKKGQSFIAVNVEDFIQKSELEAQNQ